MTPNAQDIYKSILYRAADIYEVDYDDVEKDIGQQFDPIVRFMSGALASELERVYQHINETESRLQKRLAKVILPEYYHLPQPAHALASAKAIADPILIDDTTSFKVVKEEDTTSEVALSPLFPTKITAGEIKIMATETQVVNTSKRQRLKRNQKISQLTEARKLLIGIESPEPLTNWQGVNIYFNLRGISDNDIEKDLFFAAIPNSKCTFHGYRLKCNKGLSQNDLILEDYLNGNERYESIVRARYEQHFLTFLDTEVPLVEPVLAEKYLTNWFESKNTLTSETKAEISNLHEQLKKPLYWLEIQLSKSVEVSQLEDRLEVKLNIFPVVNRKLNGNEKGGHHYLRDNSIKWVTLNPEDDFLSIRRVYEENSPEKPVFTFKPFADFKEDRKPSYTIRLGGVGRWDEFNAWQRLAYVVSILQDNYKHKELIEQAASSLSLEEVHHLLGKKIANTTKEEKPVSDIYVLLHAGIASSIRVRVEYWTSLGDLANGLATKSKLICDSKHKSSLEKNYLTLVTSTVDGKAPLNSTQQLSAMKSALLSRGRIVTREDVKVFCKTFLNEKLEEVKIKDGVGTDPRFDFGMTRILEVRLKPAPQSIKEDWEGICRQVQQLLEQKSTSSIPIKVGLLQEHITTV